MTRTMNNEEEPVIVHKEEKTIKSDLILRTEWIYDFSKIAIILGVAVGLLLDLLVSNSNADERAENLQESDEIVEGLQFLRLIPFRLLAEWAQYFAQKEFSPEFLEARLRQFVKYYHVSLYGLEKNSYSEYKTFEEFFTRKFRDDYVRNSYVSGDLKGEDAVLSPVCGTVVSLQKITSEQHKQYIKDEWYSAKQFLGTNPFDEADRIKNERVQQIESTGAEVNQVPKKDMYMCVIYLGPGDYHRFHSPVDWAITERNYISGNDYPVSAPELSFFSYKSILGTNKRVVLNGEWRHGFFSFVPVGATNVGSIHLTKEPEFNNLQIDTPNHKRRYEQPIHLKKGDEIGHFSLGSTVAFVFEYPNGSIQAIKNQHIQIGQPLLVKRTDYRNNLIDKNHALKENQAFKIIFEDGKPARVATQ